jgi:hypothetical protein
VKHGVHQTINFMELNDVVEAIDYVAKSTSLLYSVDVAILFRLKELPKRMRSESLLRHRSKGKCARARWLQFALLPGKKQLLILKNSPYNRRTMNPALQAF